MAARGQLQNFLGRINSKNLSQIYFNYLVGAKKYSEVIHILQSHSPRYGDVQVIYFKVLLKFKMATTNQLHFFGGRNN